MSNHMGANFVEREFDLESTGADALRRLFGALERVAVDEDGLAVGKNELMTGTACALYGTVVP